ncbi:hypothetical protein RHOSPDRAFT_25610 [Rhodotorula sp. JG-1b]|nr:hypothetical protein RHOSPDRAFT_25610 [Rhodotorula sp. JG-1b]
MTSRLRLLLLLAFCSVPSALAEKASGVLDHELVDSPAASRRCFLGICIPSKSPRRDILDPHLLNGAADPFLGYVASSPDDFGEPALRGGNRHHVQATSQYNTREDTVSCGFSYECVAVQNAKRVACVRGGCRVMACLDGYAPDAANLACVRAREGWWQIPSEARDQQQPIAKSALSQLSRSCLMLRQQGKHRDDEEEDEVDLLVVETVPPSSTPTESAAVRAAAWSSLADAGGIPPLQATTACADATAQTTSAIAIEAPHTAPSRDGCRRQRLAPGMCKSPLCELSDPVSYALDFDFDSVRCSNLQAPIARKCHPLCARTGSAKLALVAKAFEAASVSVRGGNISQAMIADAASRLASTVSLPDGDRAAAFIPSYPREYHDELVTTEGQAVFPAQTMEKRSRNGGKPDRLCLKLHETACPIPGSKLHPEKAKHVDEAERDPTHRLLKGGYECIDTSRSLTSCGGCVAYGKGKDCTVIRHANGVGCENGRCVVFACRRGWRPSPAGDRCLRGQPGGDHAIYRLDRPAHASRPKPPES